MLVASATAFTGVELAGAAYLVFLGLQSLRHARQTRGATDATGPVLTPKRGNPYLQGLISTVLNPMHAAITRPRIKAALERATGAVLIALGVRVAVAHRRPRSTCGP